VRLLLVTVTSRLSDLVRLLFGNLLKGVFGSDLFTLGFLVSDFNVADSVFVTTAAFPACVCPGEGRFSVKFTVNERDDLCAVALGRQMTFASFTVSTEKAPPKTRPLKSTAPRSARTKGYDE
jgi:hypothetical protein